MSHAQPVCTPQDQALPAALRDPGDRRLQRQRPAQCHHHPHHLRARRNHGWNATLFVQAGTALFILPYFLFSAIAGQFADKFDKAFIARRIKLAEIGRHGFRRRGAVARQPIPRPHRAVLRRHALAAFFGPVKYGILPQYLKKDEVVGGNALIEMGTFVTILLGTMFGGFLVIDTGGRQILVGRR